MFARFLEIDSDTFVAVDLAERGVTTRNGQRSGKKFTFRMLNNRANIGEAAHKCES